MTVSALSVFFNGSNNTRLLKQGIAGHTVEIVDVSWMLKPCGKSSRSIMLRTPPDFGVGVVWLRAGVISATATRTRVRHSQVQKRDMNTSRTICAKESLRENARADNAVPASDEPQREADGVEEPARQAPHDRAVHPDVLEIVAGVLLDEAHRAVGAQRPHAVFDELGDPLVVTIDRLEYACLRPPVEIAPERLVIGQGAPGAVEAVHDPVADLGARTFDVGEDRAVERGRRVLQHACRHRRGE